MRLTPFFGSLVSIFVLMGSVSSAANAAATLPTLSTAPCTVDSFTINTIEKSPLNGTDVIYSGGPINATKCIGIYDGNDSGGLSTPNPNLGALGDGLLNGQGGVLSSTWFQPDAPLPQSPMLDLDGDGNFTDPGWIYLGKSTRSNNGGALDEFVMDGYNLPLNMDDILNVTMACGATGCTSGTWSLETSLDIITRTQALLGRNAFDHLAFVIKASDRFAVYDFDFNLLSAGLTGFDYVTPYSFTGSWNSGDFLNQNNKAQNFSHISVWARDPVPDGQVPEPATLMLVGLGLIALRLNRKQ